MLCSAPHSPCLQEFPIYLKNKIQAPGGQVRCTMNCTKLRCSQTMSLPIVSQIICKPNSGSLHFPHCDYIHFKMYCPLFSAQRFHNSDGAICDELQVVFIC